MNGGPSSQFKPVEPGANRGGFRKIRKGDGASMVRGYTGEKVSDRRMAILAWIVLVLAGGVPTFILLGMLSGMSWCFAVTIGCLVMTHVVMVVGEITTHREIPTRGRAMLICWGTILGLSILGIVSSYV